MDILKENYNYRQILHLIINEEGMSRAQIARITNLNRSTISYIVKFFLDNNIVYETDEKVLTGGRASNLIRFNYNLEKLMLIDFQKNKLKILITNYEGLIYERFDFVIAHHQPNNIQTIKHSINRVLNKYKTIKNCGLAIHGIVSSQKQIISSPFYTYQYLDIISIFNDFNLNLYIENEANVYANAIALESANKTENLVNIHIKDGIGSGQLIDGKLYRGDNGFAGEIGHSIAIANGDKCRCGNNGCLELYCSEQALLTEIRKIVNDTVNIEHIPALIASNQRVKDIYIQAINLLAIKVNDLILFTAVEKIYITSDLYKQIPHFQTDIINRLHSNNYTIPKILVIAADTELFTTGFARLILQQQFQSD